MNFLLGIVIIIMSSFSVIMPESMLRLQDLFRIRGDRQYSEFALAMTRIGGIIGIVLGFILLFVPVY